MLVLAQIGYFLWEALRIGFRVPHKRWDMEFILRVVAMEGKIATAVVQGLAVIRDIEQGWEPAFV